MPKHIAINLMLFLILCCTLSISTTNVANGESNQQPNFVVIMADDLGYGDISCFGDPGFQTPHLDQMASEGIRLTDFHSNGPVCSPTRAALLTGRYQQRSGIDGVVFADPKQNRHHGLQMEEFTFAEALQKVGYKTGVFGKWHVGYERQYNPVKSGFDDFVGYVSGNVCYQSHLDRMGIEDWWHYDKLVPEEGYTTHLITEHTIRFIKENQQKPFCVYVAHESVHSPFQGPEDPAVREVGRVGDIKSKTVKDISRAYREMIVEMDTGIGKIVATLKELELAENTLVIFFSDNGGTKHGNNAPWSGYKGSLWEGGHRVPFIAWHPDKIVAGTESDALAVTIDIMPTLLELAGAEASDEKPLDGTSLAPLLYQQQELPKRQLYWAFRYDWAVRDGDWKLLSEGKSGRSGKPKLFNLNDDPGEKKNLAELHPETAKRMQQSYLAWKKDVQAGATPQPELAQQEQ